MLSKAAIVILNWNGWQDTVELLSSLKEATYEPLLVIVIDNASTDQRSVKEIRGWLDTNQVSHSSCRHDVGSSALDKSQLSISWDFGKFFLLIESTHNLGFCAGNNLGMECASILGAEHILILNNDTLVSPNFLEPMVEVAANDSQVGLVGGIITYCPDQQTIWWAGGEFDRFLNARRLLDTRSIEELPDKPSFETEWVSGCMMLIPTRIYQTFGGYEEDYFIWSEEWDYSLRVRQGGFHHVVATKSRICHKIGRSLGIMKPLNYYYGLRNGLFFKRKFLPFYYWYPYFMYYLINRAIRFTQLALQGRLDLAKAGAVAVMDFILGRTGIWGRQNIQ